MGESFLYVALADHRNLNGIYTDIFGLRERKKSLEEIFNKIWPVARNNSTAYKPKSLNKNPKQNALEFLALWRDFLGIASEMLEILNKIFKIIFNQNL